MAAQNEVQLLKLSELAVRKMDTNSPWSILLSIMVSDSRLSRIEMLTRPSRSPER